MKTVERILRLSETKDWHHIDALESRWRTRMNRWWYSDDGNKSVAGDAAYTIMHALKLAKDRSAFLEMKGSEGYAENRRLQITECVSGMIARHRK